MVEIKSGYGLTLEDEAKMLRVARALGHAFPGHGAHHAARRPHACRRSSAGRADDYIDTIAGEWLPALHREGARGCGGHLLRAHRLRASRRPSGCSIAARALGVPVKMHAEQLANHRRHADGDPLSRALLRSSGIRGRRTSAGRSRAAAASRWCCLSPIYCLAAARKPPPGSCCAGEGRIAIASDCNPGSAPGASLLLADEHGDAIVRAHPEEALQAVTRHAAQALGSQGSAACSPPAAADFVVWDVESLDGVWLLDRLQSAAAGCVRGRRRCCRWPNLTP